MKSVSQINFLTENVLNKCYKYICAYVAIITLLIACGCFRKEETKSFIIGHSSYFLGQLVFDKTNACVDTEFIMPDAAQVGVCLVFEGTCLENMEQMQAIHDSLVKVRLKLEDNDLEKWKCGHFLDTARPIRFERCSPLSQTTLSVALLHLMQL